MKMIKKGIIVVTLIGCMTLFTGCSVKDTWDILWGHTEKETSETDQAGTEEVFDPNAIQVDDSVEAPKFSKNLKGTVTYAAGDEAKELEVEAAVKDGGTITYQWYMNTVDSNGGGTKIEGATENKYTPDTSKTGYFYYFVVATNTVDKAMNLATSDLMEVFVDPDAEPAPKEGELKKGWGEDKTGWYYVTKDGNKVKSKWKEIKGSTYYFNKKGYMLTGWKEIKKNWYYFNNEGAMATGFVDVDGKKYFLNDKGVMQTAGWLDGDGNWFYVNEEGSLVVSQWLQIDGPWYYFNEDGVMLKNCEVDGKWLNPDGKLAE